MLRKQADRDRVVARPAGAAQHRGQPVLHRPRGLGLVRAADPAVGVPLGHASASSCCTASATRLAWLAGHRLHLRVTSRPYPAAEWARRLHRAHARTRWRHPGVEPWTEHMVTMQKHLRHQTMAEKEVFLGVRLTNRAPSPPADRARSGGTRATSSTPGCCPRSSGSPRPSRCPGWRAGRRRRAEMEWLLRRSVGIGLPAPDRAVAGRASRRGTPTTCTASPTRSSTPPTPLGRTVQLTSRGLARPGRAARGGDVGGPAGGDRGTGPRRTSRGWRTPTGCRSRWSGRASSTSCRAGKPARRSSASCWWCATCSGTTPSTTSTSRWPWTVRRARPARSRTR